MNSPEATRQDWYPILYASYYPILRDIAYEHGYALAIHGSMRRDFDLIAVAWTETAKPHEEMLAEMSKIIGMDFGNEQPYASKEMKPHGRIGYTFHAGGGGYFDISIIPATLATTT